MYNLTMKERRNAKRRINNSPRARIECKLKRAKSREGIQMEKLSRNDSTFISENLSETHPAEEQEQGKDMGGCHRCPSPSLIHSKTFRNPKPSTGKFASD
jgi:hypothetical protein